MLADKRNTLINKIFSISSGQEFEDMALKLFRFQSRKNKVYKQYIDLLGINPRSVSSLKDIPCLPVSLFKTHKILTSEEPVKMVFKSSRTGAMIPSHHYLTDINLYRTSFLKCFELFYGDPAYYCILALLPSYLEREDSSLVYMAGELIKKSLHPKSGFYLDDLGKLAANLKELEASNENTLLLGVSFALIDLSEKQDLALKNTIVMETGGMKGRRKEIIREELHSLLKSGLGMKNIHSEYGMTELLSQAYSKSDGKFDCPPWMKIMIRDSYDPFSYVDAGSKGGVNIIDLANIDSCAFIETSDLGKILPDGRFEILGRFDNSDIRGCNLLIE